MRRFHLVCLAVLAGGFTLPVFAQDSDNIKPGQERFTFGLGAVLHSFGTDVRINNPNGSQGSNVNLKDDLGVDQDASSYYASVEWRFAPRHRVGIESSVFKLTGTRTATRQIDIGDETYPVGATLSSELKLQIIPIAYSYSFIKTEKNELAATIGVHWTHMKFKAQGTASLDGQDASADVSAKVNAPMPLIGLRYDHHFSQRWSAGVQGAFFSMNFAKDALNVEGDILSARTYVEYRFSRHFGFGLAVEAFQIEIEASQGSWEGGFEYRYWGPQVYAKARF